MIYQLRTSQFDDHDYNHNNDNNTSSSSSLRRHHPLPSRQILTKCRHSMIKRNWNKANYYYYYHYNDDSLQQQQKLYYHRHPIIICFKNVMNSTLLLLFARDIWEGLLLLLLSSSSSSSSIPSSSITLYQQQLTLSTTTTILSTTNINIVQAFQWNNNNRMLVSYRNNKQKSNNNDVNRWNHHFRHHLHSTKTVTRLAPSSSPSQQYQQRSSTKLYYYWRIKKSFVIPTTSNRISNVIVLSMIQPQQLGIFESLDYNQDEINKRRVYVENWIIDHGNDNDNNNNNQMITQQTKSSQLKVHFNDSWRIQRDIIVNGHLNRLKNKNNKKYNNINDTLIPSSFLNDDDVLHFNDMNRMFSDITTNDSSIVDNMLYQKQQQLLLSSGKDMILFLEHHPVYTLGTGSDEKYILLNRNDNNNTLSSSSDNTNDNVSTSSSSSTIIKIPSPPIIRMDRGGEVTYHGPGQLIIYPIFDLKNNYKPDIHWYIRALEESVIYMLNTYILSSSTTINNNDYDENITDGHNSIQICNNNDNNNNNQNIIRAYRENNTTGVYIQNKKVAAIGIKCRSWITYHGIAINIFPECLSSFTNIVPCGIMNCQVGCIYEFIPSNTLRSTLRMSDIVHYMKLSLQHIFQIQLIENNNNNKSILKNEMNSKEKMIQLLINELK